MTLSVALIQASFHVGNVVLNVARIAAFYRCAIATKAQLVVFSEMAITGYPPEDLVLSPSFQARSMRAVEECAAMTANGPPMVIGGLWCEEGLLYNAVFLLEKGKISARQYKHCLPNYGVFDEKRTFTAGPIPEPIVCQGIKLGILICEDLWFPEPARHLKDKGAELLIAINASPFEADKLEAREQIAAQRARETGLAVVYLNQIGGHDELVFDGNSFVLDEQGECCVRLRGFREDFHLLTLLPLLPSAPTSVPGQANTIENADVPIGEQANQPCWSPVKMALPIPSWPAKPERIYRAIVLGLRDFIRKSGFDGVVLGMSGGIDSALCAALAVDAVGPEKVRTLMLPSPYTSADSLEDAAECARRLGVRIDTVSITPGMQAFEAMLSDMFGGQLTDVAEGDNQPRLRGSILMAISRKDKLLLLNTGNKSEMAVGYTTMYGDMCGHYAAIKDIYKTTVYEIAAWRNTQGDVIPARIFTKAPTAELFHGQKDQDTLPPYALLDQILVQLVENRLSIAEVAALGFELDTVEEVSNMLNRSENKRRQAAPGVKISSMSFWRDRRYPICNGWHIEQHERLGRRLAEQRRAASVQNDGK